MTSKDDAILFACIDFMENKLATNFSDESVDFVDNDFNECTLYVQAFTKYIINKDGAGAQALSSCIQCMETGLKTLKEELKVRVRVRDVCLEFNRIKTSFGVVVTALTKNQTYANAYKDFRKQFVNFYNANKPLFDEVPFDQLLSLEDKRHIIEIQSFEEDGTIIYHDLQFAPNESNLHRGHKTGHFHHDGELIMKMIPTEGTNPIILERFQRYNIRFEQCGQVCEQTLHHIYTAEV